MVGRLDLCRRDSGSCPLTATSLLGRAPSSWPHDQQRGTAFEVVLRDDVSCSRRRSSRRTRLDIRRSNVRQPRSVPSARLPRAGMAGRSAWASMTPFANVALIFVQSARCPKVGTPGNMRGRTRGGAYTSGLTSPWAMGVRPTPYSVSTGTSTMPSVDSSSATSAATFRTRAPDPGEIQPMTHCRTSDS